MIKITRDKRKSDRVKHINLLKEVGDTQYCGNCKYKKYTGLKKDYYIYKGILSLNEAKTNCVRYVFDKHGKRETWVKITRRSVFCALDKRRTLDDCVLADGLKVCGFKDWYGDHIE